MGDYRDAPAAGGLEITDDYVQEIIEAAARETGFRMASDRFRFVPAALRADRARVAAARAPSPAEVERAGLEPPGCPIPGACACPGGESRLAERLGAELRRREAAEAEVRALREENKRLRQGKDRYKAGVRAAVSWLHARASKMVDPHARQVLDSAATNLGWDLARDAALVDHAPTSAGSASADNGMQSAAIPTSAGDGHGR